MSVINSIQFGGLYFFGLLIWFVNQALLEEGASDTPPGEVIVLFEQHQHLGEGRQSGERQE